MRNSEVGGGGMSEARDRNTVLGILAVQLDFVAQDVMLRAAQDWLDDRTRPLGDLLVERKLLTTHQRHLLEPLVDEYLQQHTDGRSLSIDSVPGSQSIRAALETRQTDQRLEATVDTDELGATAAPNALAPSARAAESDVAADRQPSETDPNKPDDPTCPLGGPADPTGTSTRTGQQAGNRFIIEGLHAMGGLGAIYRAEDQEFGRAVAVKEMQARHRENPTLQSRFLWEAKINARLQHPGIVPVFSLGKFADGLPFYAMRFVEGESFDKAIQRFHSAATAKNAGQRALELRRLLGHFVDLCNAMAYAHSQGIIHRDLKPANVMLGKFGETLLIDWGLAKSIQDDGEATVDRLNVAHEDDSEFTQLGAVIGTPAYMSPEQARGDGTKVGPAADIYSLGATLFILLTGRRSVASKNVTELLQRVTEGTIEAPSAVNSDVPRPLEAICLKAMSLSPEDRYDSAGALADDIERWLADEPTQAYAEPLRDRIGRAIRHHRAAVTGLAALMLTTIIALGIFNAVSRHQNRLLREARDTAQDNLNIANSENARAEQNLEDLRQTAFELQSTAEGVLARTPGAEGERMAMTDLLVEVCEKMRRQRPNDSGLQQDLAMAYRIKGNLQRVFNHREAAEQLYRKSLALTEDLVTADPNNRHNRDRLAETLRERSHLYKSIGDLQKAIDDLSRASQIVTELLTDDPTSPAYRRTAATIRQSLADVQFDFGLADAATSNIAFAVTTLTALVDDPHSIPTDQPALLLALNRQGEMLRQGGDLKGSTSALQIALKKARDASGDGDNNTQHSLARILLDLGQTEALDPQQLDDANRRFDEAIAIWTQLSKAFPSIAFYQRYRIAALTAQAELRIKSGDTEQAIATLEQSRQQLEPIVKQVPKIIAYRSTLVDVLIGMAHAALATGKTDHAKSLYAEAIGHMEQITAQTPQNVTAQQKLEQLRDELKAISP